MKRILPFAALLALNACDYVDKPLGDNEGPVVIIGTAPRKVLLEDLTGHRCNNCPEAAIIAENLKAIYDTNLVVVGVHMTDAFAAPGMPLGDDSLDTDFRTTAGDTYENEFQVPSLPKGLVSRTVYNNTRTLSRTNWSSAVAAIIGQEAQFKLWFHNISYNAGNNSVTTTVKALCTEAISGDHNLVVYLTEDHVIAGQIDQAQSPPYVPDYEHRHVLRGNVNGTWGEALVTGSATAGDTLTRTYTYTLPSNVLQPANCSLVAYVCANGPNAYEVKQVQEQKMQP